MRLCEFSGGNWDSKAQLTFVHSSASFSLMNLYENCTIMLICMSPLSLLQPDMSKLSLNAGSMWEKMMDQMMPEICKTMKFFKMLPGKQRQREREREREREAQGKGGGGGSSERDVDRQRQKWTGRQTENGREQEGLKRYANYCIREHM